MKEEIKTIVKSVSDSKKVKRMIVIIACFAVLSIVFQAGVVVGFKKASFGKHWGENYERNFGMVKHNRMMGDTPDRLPNAHGAIGKIAKIELPNIIVTDNDGIEKIVVLNVETLIKKGPENILEKDLLINDFIVVVGTPNDKGQIVAKLIRVIPSPMMGAKAEVIK
ncbi:MAG: hypothetical protein NTX85_01450 [Candidatus Nomurabacteria bacterium]|nr:hypothetical protein [Candidatus Nomurabacteria bacterium]